MPPNARGRGGRYAPGDFARYAIAAQATDADFENFVALSNACDGRADDMATAINRSMPDEDEAPQQPFLVPGLIPRGVVTLLAGNRKAGKSTLALELAVAAAREQETHWAGFPVERAPGFAVFVAGENSERETADRVKLMTGGTSPFRLWIVKAPNLGHALDLLKEKRVSLLVVGPGSQVRYWRRRRIRGCERLF